MRVVARSIYIAILTLFSAVAIAWAATISSAVMLVADPIVLIMGGSGRPHPEPEYVDNIMSRYVNPFAALCQTETCQRKPIYTPEQFFPVYGGLTALTFDQSVDVGVNILDDRIRDELATDPDAKLVVFGYSQSGRIVSLEIRRLQDPAFWPTPVPADQLEFVVIGSWSRPNGGLAERFAPHSIPILGITFDGATPTDSGYQVTDIGFEYDPVSDFPLYITNLLAVLNSVLAFHYVHGTFPDPVPRSPDSYPYGFPPPLDDPSGPPGNILDVMEDNTYVYPEYPNNTYVLIPAKTLPLLQPVRDLAANTGTTSFVEPILQLIEPTLRYLIDLGYDRSIPFAQPTRARLFPFLNPLTVAEGLVNAAEEGVANATGGLSATSVAPSDNSTLAARSVDQPTDSKYSTAKQDTEPVVTKGDDDATDAKTPKPKRDTVTAPRQDRPKVWRPTAPKLPGITGPRSPLSRLFHPPSASTADDGTDKVVAVTGADGGLGADAPGDVPSGGDPV